MKLTVHIESGDLGTQAGVARTMLIGPNEASIFFDPSRMADPMKIRDLVIEELDKVLIAMAIAESMQPRPEGFHD